ncbi:MAG: hypothetical protein ACM31D_04245 [Bacteroidota bacterium]
MTGTLAARAGALVPIILATGLGYLWLGAPGALIVCGVGLWGRYGAASPWSFGGTVANCVVVFGTPLLVALLWTVASFRPDFAETLFSAMQPWTGRALDFTHGDEDAYQHLAARGRLAELPVIRMGIALCWLTAMPVAAAAMLWHRDLPTSELRKRSFAEEKAAGGLFILALFVANVWVYGNEHYYKSLMVFGWFGYPVVCMLWIVFIIGVRRWMNWLFPSCRLTQSD